MRAAPSEYYRGRPRGPGRTVRRQSGIALMVVMVLFAILSVVVFQLQYSTKLEEELSEARSTESQGTFAITSVTAYVLTLLADDFRNDATGQGGAVGPGAVGGATGEPAGFDPANPTAGEVTGRGAETGDGVPPPTAAAGFGAAASPRRTIDSILENIFLPNTQNVNGVTIKLVTRDNERTFDLNQLWIYPRLRTETLGEEEEERERMEENEEARLENEDPSDSEEEDGPRVQHGTREDARALLDEFAEEPQELNTARLEWVPPTEEQREAVREMLTRVIDLMYRLNYDRGFDYQFITPDPTTLALAIEDYCFQRRSATFQNTISLVSELLNLPDVTPEVFYGPMPNIPPGEELYDPQEIFAYRKDEFGDLQGEFLLANQEWIMDREERLADLEQFVGMEGPLANIPELGRLGNPMTRNMQEYAEDELGEGLMVPPVPIGLRDLFSTQSSGKININTAPPPIIYGLLLSLPEEDAEKVALDVEFHRYRYQEIMSEEEMEGSITDVETTEMINLGQPRRRPPPTEEELNELAPEERAEFYGDMGDQDYETNYFTSLDQLVLIDGEEGDQEDLLRMDDLGAEDSPVALAKRDLELVHTLGGTYFTVTLKARAENSPVVKEGQLVIHRDTQKRRIEILQWKELER